MKKPSTNLAQLAWLTPLAIFTLAFVVRMAFVWQATESPYWRVPLIDARTYDAFAKELIRVSWLAPLPDSDASFTPYFQPPLYPIFLAVIYKLLGPSVISAVFVQYLIGSICCVLTYLLGRRYFGSKVGTVAGVAMALTATQIYYEGRLLPPVLIILLNLAVLLLAAKQMESAALWRWPVIGLLAGLSAITRPDILLFVPALLAWMWIERKTLLARRPVFCAVSLLLGILLPVGLTAARNHVVGRDSVPISSNGGINFYIGNHPEIDRTLGIRPGIGWSVLTYEPLIKTGSTKPSDWDAYFYRRAFAEMGEHKSATLMNFVRKSAWVWRGPEIRRNEDEYYLRRVSPLYRALLWRVGNFGFPFGIIAPLALLGLVTNLSRRRELLLPYAYVVTQVLMLVAYFPCTRYRVPLTPVLLIFGAAAALQLLDPARRPGRLVLLLAFGVLSMLCPPGFEGTAAQREADNCWMLGVANYIEKNPVRAMRAFEQGIRLDPENADLHNWLAILHSAERDYDRAEFHACRTIFLEPEYAPAYEMLADIYTRAGKPDKAAETLRLIRTNRELWRTRSL